MLRIPYVVGFALRGDTIGDVVERARCAIHGMIGGDSRKSGHMHPRERMNRLHV